MSDESGTEMERADVGIAATGERAALVPELEEEAIDDLLVPIPDDDDEDDAW